MPGRLSPEPKSGNSFCSKKQIEEKLNVSTVVYVIHVLSQQLFNQIE